jgi:hypothetical protein
MMLICSLKTLTSVTLVYNQQHVTAVCEREANKYDHMLLLTYHQVI